MPDWSFFKALLFEEDDLSEVGGEELLLLDELLLVFLRSFFGETDFDFGGDLGEVSGLDTSKIHAMHHSL